MWDMHSSRSCVRLALISAACYQPQKSQASEESLQAAWTKHQKLQSRGFAPAFSGSALKKIGTGARPRSVHEILIMNLGILCWISQLCQHQRDLLIPMSQGRFMLAYLSFVSAHVGHLREATVEVEQKEEFKCRLYDVAAVVVAVAAVSKRAGRSSSRRSVRSSSSKRSRRK